MTADRLAPRVRVGVVSWNTADLLDRCLAALPAALDGLPASVVVVDNASSDDSAARAEAHGVTVIRNTTNEGYARAMNAALADPHADVLIACNPDCEPPPRSLRLLVEALEEDPTRAVVVPRLAEIDGSLQHSVYRFPGPWTSLALALLPVRVLRGRIGQRLWLEGSSPHDRSVEVDWAIGAVHVIRASALDAAPYDERWFMYVEDLDLCWRLRQSGRTVWLEHEVTVPHVGNASGRAAWGAARTRRWQWATYDWIALRRGQARQRLLAALNLFATLAILARSAVLAAGSARARGRLRSRWAAQRPMLAVHARAAVFGVARSGAEWGPPGAST